MHSGIRHNIWGIQTLQLGRLRSKLCHHQDSSTKRITMRSLLQWSRRKVSPKDIPSRSIHSSKLPHIRCMRNRWGIHHKHKAMHMPCRHPWHHNSMACHLRRQQQWLRLLRQVMATILCRIRVSDRPACAPPGTCRSRVNQEQGIRSSKAARLAVKQ